jgi:hypothetical protein
LIFYRLWRANLGQERVELGPGTYGFPGRVCSAMEVADLLTDERLRRALEKARAADELAAVAAFEIELAHRSGT